MGYSTCLGHPLHPHPETRSCDGCDRCPRCSGFKMARMYCWRCCGPLHACPNCRQRLASHIVEKGPPEGDWRIPEILAGYQRAQAEIQNQGG